MYYNCRLIVLCIVLTFSFPTLGNVERSLLAVSCSEILESSPLFIGIVVSDDIWRAAGNQLQPLVDCLPSDKETFLVFNTTRVLRPSKTVIKAKQSVTFISLDEFSHRLNDDDSITQKRLTKFQCPSKESLFKIKNSVVIIDHIEIEDCDLETDSMIWVSGQLEIRNSLFENVRGNKGTALLHGEPNSVIEMQNVTFHGNQGTTLIRSIESSHLEILDSLFVQNRAPKKDSLLSIRRNAQFQLGNTQMVQNEGGCIQLEDTISILKNNTFLRNTVHQQSIIHTKAKDRATSFEASICQFQSNVGDGAGTCFFLEGALLNATLIGVTADLNLAQSGAAVTAIDVGYLLMDFCEFYNNKAIKKGGALDLRSETSLPQTRIQRTSFSFNSANSGGAISIFGKGIVDILLDTSFSNNNASKTGGAIRCKGETGKRNETVLRLINSYVLENQASDGAGLYLSTAVGYISDGTRFQSNIATKTGGGVFASNEARVVFMDSDISLNEATNGGAIYGVDFESTGLNIEIMGNVTLRQNTAEENGGALYLEGNRTTFLIEGESRVEENNAKSKGGGICAVDIQPFLAKSTAFVNNGATNGGAVYVEAKRTAVDFRIENCSFDTNRANYGGGVYFQSWNLKNLTSVFKDETLFVSNEAFIYGGGIYNNGSADIQMAKTSFLNNNAIEKGGAIYSVQEGTSFQLKNVLFEENRATFGGGLAIEAFSRIEMLPNILFSKNSASAGGAIFLETDIQFSSSGARFVNNSATGTSQGGGAIFSKTLSKASEFKIQNSLFELNIAQPNFVPFGDVSTSGGAFYASGNATIEFQDTDFRQNGASTHGGAIFVQTIESIHLTNGNFTENNAGEDGGSVCIQDISGPSDIKDGSFVSNSALRGGAVSLSRHNATFTISGKTLMSSNRADKTGGAIFAEDVSVMLSNTRLENNEAGTRFSDYSQCVADPFRVNLALSYGGGVHIQSTRRNDISATIAGLRFVNNSATVGGGLSFIAIAGFNISDAIFSDNVAQTGGALLLDTTKLFSTTTNRLQDSTFGENKACQGGAVYAVETVETDKTPSVKIQWKRNAFYANYAENSGGVLHVQRNPSLFSICCYCDKTDPPKPLNAVIPDACRGNMRENDVGILGYGPVFATDAVGLVALPSTIARHRSGELLPPIRIRNVDAFSQSVPNKYLEVALTNTTDVLLEGQNRSNLILGEAVFDNVFLSAIPGNYTIEVLRDGIPSTKVVVNVALCAVWERLEDLYCVECDNGILGDEDGCIDCPSNAKCENGNVIPSNGYWNIHPSSLDVLKCVQPKACTVILAPSATEDFETYEQPCSKGYEGVLCGACEDGYGHFAAQECEPCNERLSWFVGILSLLYLLWVSFWLMRTSWATDIERRNTLLPSPLDHPRSSMGHTSNLTLETEIDDAPVPEHVEPTTSFGIRNNSDKEPLKYTRSLPETSTNEETIVASGQISARTPRPLAPVIAGGSESSTPNDDWQTKNEIAPELRAKGFTLPHAFSLEMPHTPSTHPLLTKPLLSEALKILITFFQSVSLAVFVQLNWNQPIKTVLRLFHFLGTGFDAFISPECIFDGTDETPASIRRFSFMLIAPILLAALLLCIWLFVFIFDRSFKIFQQHIKNAWVALFYVSFLPISHTCFRILNCTSIPFTPEEKYVWAEDTDVICYEGAHRKLLFALCIPLMVLVMVIFPCSFLVFLTFHRNLGKTGHLRSWGLLFEAYKYKRPAIFAFSYQYSLRVQCLMAIGVTVLALLAHSIFSPYEKSERMLAHMETLSLFGSFTVYFIACLLHAWDEGFDVICYVLSGLLILVVLRLIGGVFEHVSRNIDWTLGEYGKEAYYRKPWLQKLFLVYRLKFAFLIAFIQRCMKRCNG